MRVVVAEKHLMGLIYLKKIQLDFIAVAVTYSIVNG